MLPRLAVLSHAHLYSSRSIGAFLLNGECCVCFSFCSLLMNPARSCLYSRFHNTSLQQHCTFWLSFPILRSSTLASFRICSTDRRPFKGARLTPSSSILLPLQTHCVSILCSLLIRGVGMGRGVKNVIHTGRLISYLFHLLL